MLTIAESAVTPERGLAAVFSGTSSPRDSALAKEEA
jgi:hypothetical protein